MNYLSRPVHVDVLSHGLKHGVGAGVPVKVGLLLVDVLQLGHRLRHRGVQPAREKYILNVLGYKIYFLNVFKIYEIVSLGF